MKSIFITGTDTDAGKTYVSVLLLEAITQAGLKSIGFKPIAAGCEKTPEGLRNDDALKLQAAASVKLPYNMINPLAFEPPIAPHIAAAQIGQAIDMQLVLTSLRKLQNEDADVLLVEGAGGWRLPITLPSSTRENRAAVAPNAEHILTSTNIAPNTAQTLTSTNNSGPCASAAMFLSDFVKEQKLPVILVVGMKLGCLNHAALTLEQVKRDNCELIGWIANQIDPDMACYNENLESLHVLLDAPFLAEVKHHQKSIAFAENTLELILQS